MTGGVQQPAAAGQSLIAVAILQTPWRSGFETHCRIENLRGTMQKIRGIVRQLGTAIMRWYGAADDFRAGFVRNYLFPACAIGKVIIAVVQGKRLGPKLMREA